MKGRNEKKDFKKWPDGPPLTRRKRSRVLCITMYKEYTEGNAM